MSVHRQAAENATREFMRTRAGCEVVTTWLDRLRDGTVTKYENIEMVNAIFQKPFRPDLCDAYCFAQIRSMVLSGEIEWSAFWVGQGPMADKARAENREILRSALPSSMKADIWDENCTEGDGSFSWSKPLTFIRSWAGKRGKETTARTIVPKGRFVLEVGSTEASRTLLWLRGPYLGLARWPYGSSWLTLFRRHEIGAIL